MTAINPITPAEAGITLAVLSGPRGDIDTDKREGKEHVWPHIAYTVELSINGKPFWTGPYKLGIGHVDIRQRTSLVIDGAGMTSVQHSMLNAWHTKPHADFTNKELQAEVAAILAKKQGIRPKLEDVMHSLLMDGSAHFDSETFEDWCANFGHDTDSRKAEETYRECEEIGKKLMRALGRDKINGLREWASNY